MGGVQTSDHGPGCAMDSSIDQLTVKFPVGGGLFVVSVIVYSTLLLTRFSVELLLSNWKGLAELSIMSILGVTPSGRFSEDRLNVYPFPRKVTESTINSDAPNLTGRLRSHFRMACGWSPVSN